MKRKLLSALAIGFMLSNVVLAQKTGSGSSSNNSNNNNTTPTQNWKTEISSNYFYIRVADNASFFWDLSGTHPETAKKDLQFQIWNNDNDVYERTFIFPQINGTDYYAIKNKAGFIVDVAGKNELNAKEIIEQKAGKKFKMKKNDGVEIQTWTYDSKGVAKWQQWRLVIVDKNTVMFESVNSEKAITIKDGNVNGSKLIQKTRVNDNTQKFVLVYADGPKKGQLLNFEE